MSTVINQITGWASKELDYWEKLTLDMILTKSELSDEDRKEILGFALEEVGLTPKRPEPRPKLNFADQLKPNASATKHRIERIFNLRNVNALPTGQEIRFAHQLTLIYGDNAAGKTGYARPLGCAAFARGQRDVLPDIEKKDASALTPQADIEISCGGGVKVFTWSKGLPRPPELNGFYVFDSKSLDAHLNRANPMHFSPSGLDVLTRLVAETDPIRSALKQQIDALENSPNNFLPFFDSESVVSRAMNSLCADTNIEGLRTLAQLSDDETTAIKKLDQEIAGLKITDSKTRLSKLRRESNDLQDLIAAVDRADASLGAEKERQVATLISNLQARLRESTESSTEHLKSDFFTHVGSAIWREFLRAAKALADAESGPRGTYPITNDPCLLCWQPLTPEAAAFINRLWKFLQSEPETKLQTVRSTASTEIQELETLNLNYFPPNSTAYQLLEKELPVIVPMVEAQASAARDRREVLINSLRSESALAVPPAIALNRTDINTLIQIRNAQITELEGENTEARITTLENSLRELKHRAKLSDILPQVEKFVADKRRAKAARSRVGSTQRITLKHNKLFEKLVTERYTKLFQGNLSKFNSDLRVGIKPFGQKGERVRQIILTRAAREFPLEEVLSDGEKRIVAFADFLTEAEMDEACQGIILDDPVTSLDNSWKRALANCLVEQAQTKQVVIFTHDLAFLYLTKKAAENLKVEIAPHWVRAEGGQPGFVYPNNGPMCERDFKSAARATECYSKAKALPPSDQELVLMQGFGLLRDSYEALVVFFVFNDVVRRFDERIGYDQLRRVRTDADLLNQIADRMEALSRRIDAHLHSDALAGPSPTPEELRKEIDAFEIIKARQRALVAAAAS